MVMNVCKYLARHTELVEIESNEAAESSGFPQTQHPQGERVLVGKTAGGAGLRGRGSAGLIHPQPREGGWAASEKPLGRQGWTLRESWTVP